MDNSVDKISSPSVRYKYSSNTLYKTKIYSVDNSDNYSNIYHSVDINSLLTLEKESLDENFSPKQFYSSSIDSTTLTCQKLMNSCPNYYIKKQNTKKIYGSPSIYYSTTYTEKVKCGKQIINTIRSRKILNDISNTKNVNTISKSNLYDNKKLSSNDNTSSCISYYDSHYQTEQNNNTIDYNQSENQKFIIDPIVFSFHPSRLLIKKYYQGPNIASNIDEMLSNMINGPSYVPIYSFNQNINLARIKLIEWIFDFVYGYRMATDCAFLSIKILDTILHNNIDHFKCSKYQLIAITALFISSKLFDVSALPLQDCIYASCDQYTENEIIDTEMKIFSHPDIDLYSINFLNLLEFLYTKFEPFFIDQDYSFHFLGFSEICLMLPSILTSYSILEICSSLVCIIACENTKLDISMFKQTLINVSKDVVKITSCAMDILKLASTFNFKPCPSTQLRLKNFLNQTLQDNLVKLVSRLNTLSDF